MSDFIVYTSEQMPNEAYHDPEGPLKDYVSGSSLGKIFQSCEAAWKFSQNDKSKALEFGTQSHTNFESKWLFERTYRRAPLADEIDNCITSQAALASKLKSIGLTGTSGKTYPDLIKMMLDAEQDFPVLWLYEQIESARALVDGVELIDAKSYDACVNMRAVLESIPEHNKCMNSTTAQRELTITGTIAGVKVKVRLDHVDVVQNYSIRERGPDGDWVTTVYPEVVVITDYKTTSSANPAEFGRLVANHGYLLKMALQRDLFKKAYNEKRPIIVRLLAQEKAEPYLPLAFRLNDKQISIGRRQYMSVIKRFEYCQANDVWPSYANNEPEVELEMPAWFMKQYESVA